MIVKCIAQTKIDPIAMKEMLAEALDCHNYEPKQGTHAESLIAYAGRRCYNSFEIGKNPNVTKIRENICDYIDNILLHGHGSVLEHVYFTFAIEGISRVLTAELNRHRAGAAISEGSGRYIRITDHIPFVYSEFFDPFASDPLAQKKIASRSVIDAHLQSTLFAYKMLENIWAEELATNFTMKKKLTSAFRRIMPMGLATGGTWTYNVRAIRHILDVRGSVHAEEEILRLANEMLSIMVDREPSLFGDFHQTEEGLTPTYSKV